MIQETEAVMAGGCLCDFPNVSKAYQHGHRIMHKYPVPSSLPRRLLEYSKAATLFCRTNYYIVNGANSHNGNGRSGEQTGSG